jgi:hypothetical protein
MISREKIVDLIFLYNLFFRYIWLQFSAGKAPGNYPDLYVPIATIPAETVWFTHTLRKFNSLRLQLFLLALFLPRSTGVPEFVPEPIRCRMYTELFTANGNLHESIAPGLIPSVLPNRTTGQYHLRTFTRLNF